MVSNGAKLKTRKKMKRTKAGKANKKERRKGVPPFPIHPKED